MKKKLKKLNFKNNKGITGVDIAIAVIVITIFTGLIAEIMYSSYVQGLNVQKAANANSYATIILEKTDEKPFEEVTNDFIDNLKNSGEIDIDGQYNISMNVEDLNQMMKKVTVDVKYKVNEEEKEISFSKLKVKELGDE